ncbi:MAG: ABC transporter substrate-binding protein [Nitrospira sp.]
MKNLSSKGSKLLGNQHVRPYREVQPGVEVSHYLTTDEFFQKNPETVRKFYRALSKGIDWFNVNRKSAEALRMISGFSKLPVEVLAQLQMISLPKKMDVKQVQQTAELMKKAGMLKVDIDAKSIVDPTIAK